MTDDKHWAEHIRRRCCCWAWLGIALDGAGLAPSAPSFAQSPAATINVVVQPAATGLPMVVAEKKGMLAKRNVDGQADGAAGADFLDTINTLGRQFDIAGWGPNRR